MNRTITHDDRSHFLPRRWLAAVGCVMLLLVVPLFAIRSPAHGSISGQVTSHGKTVVIGTVVMLAADDRLYSAPINDLGRYAFDNVPAGKARFGVISRDPKKTDERHAKLAKADTRLTSDIRGQAPTVDAKKWFEIFGRYEDPRLSGLEFDVAGATAYDIKLD